MITRSLVRRSRKAGLPPGTLVHVGEQKAAQVLITILDYDEAGFRESVPAEAAACAPYIQQPTVTWINVDGVHNSRIIEKLGRDYGIHPLVLEDIMSTGQRPKMEELEDQIFLVLKMIYPNGRDDGLNIEQISLLLGKNFVLSFQEAPGDIFDPVRERIRKAKGRIRRSGADYLAYALLDAVVDNYFLVFETLGEEIEALEEELIADPTSATLQAIHEARRTIISLRQPIWRAREVVADLLRMESPLVQESTGIYLRDVSDHLLHILDTQETYRETVSSLLDLYLSSFSNKTNEVMRVLTIIATLFIPLTFIAGVYGMNFKHMPELEWRWAYPAFWAFMLVTLAGMLMYFKRKKWL